MPSVFVKMIHGRFFDSATKLITIIRFLSQRNGSVNRFENCFQFLGFPEIFGNNSQIFQEKYKKMASALSVARISAVFLKREIVSRIDVYHGRRPFKILWYDSCLWKIERGVTGLAIEAPYEGVGGNEGLPELKPRGMLPPPKSE